MNDFEDDEDLAMEEEDSADEYSILTEAGFSPDKADAIVAAIRACMGKGEDEEAPMSEKGEPGDDALALLIGAGPKKKKGK